jgi:hypothetical protein
MEALRYHLQPWEVVTILLIPSLFWLGRGLWLWRRESARRRMLARSRTYYSPEPGRWEGDE